MRRSVNRQIVDNYRDLHDDYSFHIYVYIYVFCAYIPVVLHKAVAEASMIGNYTRGELL